MRGQANQAACQARPLAALETLCMTPSIKISNLLYGENRRFRIVKLVENLQDCHRFQNAHNETNLNGQKFETSWGKLVP